MALEFGGIKVESGTVTLDEGPAYAVAPIERVDGAALEFIHHPMLLALAVISGAVAAMAGHQQELQMGGGLFLVLFGVGYFATRQTRVVVHAGGLRLGTKAGFSGRKKAEDFVDGVAEQIQACRRQG